MHGILIVTVILNIPVIKSAVYLTGGPDLLCDLRNVMMWLGRLYNDFNRLNMRKYKNCTIYDALKRI